MQHYRLYLLDSAGHIRRAVIIEAADDDAAIEACPKDDASMELWRGDRMVRKFGPHLQQRRSA